MKSILFGSCLIGLWLVLSNPAPDKLRFWDQQRKGTNWFNETPTREWLVDAKNAGITLARLAPNKWKSAKRDFLIGDADHYKGLVPQDMSLLQKTLDQANEVGVKIVFTTLSLPGARWRQQNNDKQDLRLWQKQEYQDQAAQFWRDLAQRLRKHPAVVGFNIVNEPTPELTAGLNDPSSEDLQAWYSRAKGTPADLNRFYEKMIHAIREVDPDTPILIDSGLWASPKAITYLQPEPSRGLIYCVHMYDPFEYTNRKVNANQFSYPASNLNASRLETLLQPVVDWQRARDVSANRIFVEEFGCNRTVGGAAAYLGDLISLFNRRGWHWAFYAFREDEWKGMDYELGTQPPGQRYWDAQERGENPQLQRVDSPLWRLFQNEFPHAQTQKQ